MHVWMHACMYVDSQSHSCTLTRTALCFTTYYMESMQSQSRETLMCAYFSAKLMAEKQMDDSTFNTDPR